MTAKLRIGKSIISYKLAKDQESLPDYILSLEDGKKMPIPGETIFTVIDGTCYYFNLGYKAEEKGFKAYTRMDGESDKETEARLKAGKVVVKSRIRIKVLEINSIDEIFVR